MNCSFNLICFTSFHSKQLNNKAFSLSLSLSLSLCSRVGLITPNKKHSQKTCINAYRYHMFLHWYFSHSPTIDAPPPPPGSANRPTLISYDLDIVYIKFISAQYFSVISTKDSKIVSYIIYVLLVARYGSV